MDFFFKNLEAAQLQAKNAAASAQKSAKGLAAQMSDQTKVIVDHASTLAGQVTENTRALAGSLPAAKSLQEHADLVSGQTKALAERAGHVSSAAAEQATTHLKSLGLSEKLTERLSLLARHGGSEPPSAAELEAYGITPDFCDFVRSLTYSTFRDFHDAAAQSQPSAPCEGTEEGPSGTSLARRLTPWQEHHAMLVVRYVKEVNELRYVLCPKRLRDAEFWGIYFTLARKFLPPEAYEPSAPLPKPDSPADRAWALDWQARLADLSSTARTWGAGTAAPLRSLVSGARGARAGPAAAEPACRAASGAQQRAAPAAEAPAAELGADPEFEACLQDAMGHGGQGTPRSPARVAEGAGACVGAGPAAKSSGAACSQADGDDDFEQYLSELDRGEGGSGAKSTAEDGEEGSGEELDLEELMKDIGDEDVAAAAKKP